MKNYLLTAFIVGFMVCLSSSEAIAQKKQKLSVEIPFEFTVMDKKFEAGTYVVSDFSDNGATGFLRLRRFDGKEQIILLTQRAKEIGRYHRLAVKFNRYGEKYFLSAIFNPMEGFGREVLKSKMEVLTAREFKNRKLKAAPVILSKNND